MRHKKKLTLLFSLLVAPSLYAAQAVKVPASVLVSVPQGAVACLSQKAAANYALYSQQAPDFAADLLARASCFTVEKAEEAVKLGAEKGFTKLKLLSGHVVWLPESR